MITSSSTYISPITGQAVPLEILQCIGVFRQLQEAYIITYTLQNYDFSGHGILSTLLARQITNGAKIKLMTTPPPGKPHKSTFKEKLRILEQLDHSGIELYLHDNLHAKVYLFLDDMQKNTTIVGSANLSHRGFGRPGSSQDNLLELALITNEPNIYHSVLTTIQNSFINDKMTSDFSTWKTNNHSNIAIAKAGGRI